MRKRPTSDHTAPNRFVNPLSLVSLCIATAVYGVGYFMADTVDFDGEAIRSVRLIGSLPFEVYGALWLTVGAAGFIGMFSRNVFRIAYSAMSALFLTWSLICLAAFFLTGAQGIDNLMSAAIWGALTMATFTLATIELTDEKIGEDVDAMVKEERADHARRRALSKGGADE